MPFYYELLYFILYIIKYKDPFDKPKFEGIIFKEELFSLGYTFSAQKSKIFKINYTILKNLPLFETK